MQTDTGIFMYILKSCIKLNLQNLSDMADLPGIDQDLTFSKEIAAQMLEYKANRYIIDFFLFVKNCTSTYCSSLLGSFTDDSFVNFKLNDVAHCCKCRCLPPSAIT